MPLEIREIGGGLWHKTGGGIPYSDVSFFRKQADEFAEVVWKKGLLVQKGLGLCHSAAGRGEFLFGNKISKGLKRVRKEFSNI